MYLLKISVFLLFPLLALADSYYEARGSNGETAIQQAPSAQQGPQQQGQNSQLSGQQLQQQPQVPNNGYQPFGAFSLQAPSFFGLGESANTFPLLCGAVLGIALVYFWQWLTSGWGRKLLASKFYGYEEEVVDEPENGDLKKETVTPHKADEAKPAEEAKSRRKRHAMRLARTAGRIQRSIDDFENKYRPDYY